MVRGYVAVLRHGLQARDLSPLWAETHLWLANHADQLQQADPPSVYRGRAKLVAADDPGIWYRCGRQEMADGQRDQAWHSWRRSLELSALYLSEIVDRSAEDLDPPDILREVLPDRPETLVKAAADLFPDPEMTAERQPFLEKALALLERRPPPRKADDLYLEGRIYRSWGRWTEAAVCYEKALAQEPYQADWRCEYARVLRHQDRLQEARRELLTVLEQQPGHDGARRLLDLVTRELEEMR
jgi:tetratricopeptide (TPR) repeat protein